MAYNDLECNVKREGDGVYTNQVLNIQYMYLQLWNIIELSFFQSISEEKIIFAYFSMVHFILIFFHLKHKTCKY